ncbi:hypothetical protein [Merismopedia glauca]|uniref:Uncharacterized protein n=2 Tax=Merismopedia TaxID=53402 RepID=A0A2T1BWN9_9CYAN|nr:hypothetical protein [Merismopedia glauca]PSB00327.1 hypothetical protein C7B64_24125 [Merismopedia glauca CCAP 1448/3]
MLNTLQHRMAQHQLLSDLRLKLLRLHKLLLDVERLAYEQVWGRVSTGQLWQLAIDSDQFRWLHQLSELIVQIDLLLDADEPVTSEAIASLSSHIGILLTPNQLGSDFAIKYDAVFQRHPDVVLAHADVVTLLASVS